MTHVSSVLSRDENPPSGMLQHCRKFYQKISRSLRNFKLSTNDAIYLTYVCVRARARVRARAGACVSSNRIVPVCRARSLVTSAFQERHHSAVDQHDNHRTVPHCCNICLVRLGNGLNLSQRRS